MPLLRKLQQLETLIKPLYASKLEKHLNKVWTHQHLSVANWYQSKCFAHECMTLMHDKMDPTKTTSPMSFSKAKYLNGLTKLPLSVTSILAYGHGDVRYDHYGLDLYPHDTNYIVGSIAKLF